MAFVVQGEGRGHMTQALALAGFLRAAGHTVDTVLVGRSRHRSVPDYFSRGLGVPVETFDAPIQVPDARNRGVSGPATALDAVRRLPGFVRAAFRIHEAVAGADVVVNFLDLVAGVSRVVLRTQVPVLAVAHNYLFLDPELDGVPGGKFARAVVRGWIRATAAGAGTPVALGFRAPATQAVRTGRSPRLLPPLLRPGLAALEPTEGGYLLAYALNPGYGGLLAEWHRSRPEIEVHCYLDGGSSALTVPSGPTFHVHALDEQAFLSHLAGCRAYVGSAGFESICEAHYLGKPVLAVPTEGHLEQVWNAWDAERCGAATAGGYADMDRFWDGSRPPDPDVVRAFRAWVARAPEMHVRAVEETAMRARL